MIKSINGVSKMKVSQMIEKLNLELVSGNDGIDRDVEGVYSGDLLSVVMANAKENQVWLTVQTHINIVAIASLVDLSAVIVVEDMEIEEDTINKSNTLGIPLLKTDKNTYEISVALHELGIDK